MLNGLRQLDNERRHTPSTAIVDFDGDITTVRAHHVRLCVPSRQCMTFCVQTIAIGVLFIVSLTMLIVTPPTDVVFNVWLSLFSVAIGVFIPSPDYADIIRTD